jgi:hypothetical protein
MKGYKVTLTDQERSRLEKWVSTGRRSAPMLGRARIWWKAEAAQQARWSEQEIVAAFDLSLRTVERPRPALAEEGGRPP